MRQQYNIYSSLKSAFLATQENIYQIQPGSVVDSLLYASSREFTLAFSEIDTIKNNFYINTASDQYLDALIEGFAGLRRLDGKNSVGYAVFELNEVLTLENIDNSLNFSFSQYNETGSVVSGYSGTVTIPVFVSGSLKEYTVVAPLNYNFNVNEFSSTGAGTQSVFLYYKQFLKTLLNKYKKPIKYLVLPIASKQIGIENDVPSGLLELSVNLGVQTIVRNSYNFNNAMANAFAALSDSTVSSDVIMADIDTVVSPENSLYGLKNFSYITGGTNIESDVQYRQRFYSYINSFSKGTLDSIEVALRGDYPTARLNIVETNNPGVVDIYVDADIILSKPILQRMTAVVNENKPAGIYVNIKPTKNIFISILADIESNKFKDSVESIRSYAYSSINSRPLSSTIEYDELTNFTLLADVSKRDNFFYGEFLDEFLFDLYKDELQKIYYNFGVRSSNTVNNTNEPWKNLKYLDVYNQIIYNESSIFLSYKNAKLQYPLIQFVKNSLAFTEAEKNSLKDTDRNLVDYIKQTCLGIKPSQCLKQAFSLSSYENFSPVNFNSIAINNKISLETISNVVNKEYSNYFKIKLLTLPFIRKEPESLAIQLIKKTLTNDVINITYDDLTIASLNSLEKLRLMQDFNIASGLYVDAGLVGLRPLER